MGKEEEDENKAGEGEDGEKEEDDNNTDNNHGGAKARTRDPKMEKEKLRERARPKSETAAILLGFYSPFLPGAQGSFFRSRRRPPPMPTVATVPVNVHCPLIRTQVGAV